VFDIPAEEFLDAAPLTQEGGSSFLVIPEEQYESQMLKETGDSCGN